MANIITVANVQGYVDTQDKAWLNAEAVARGFGFTQIKNGVEYVRWETINGYLKTFGFSQRVGKDDYIPENMVYRLGFKANNEAANKFQELLADEVIPEIRKHGGYMIAKKEDTPETIMARAVLIAQETIKRQEQLLLEANTKIAEDAPYVDYAEELLGCKNDVDMLTAARTLADNGIKDWNGKPMGRTHLFKILRANGVLMKNNKPYQRFIDRGLFGCETYTFPTYNGVRSGLTTLVKPEGMKWLLEQFKAGKFNMTNIA